MDGMDTLSFRPANHADIPALVALVTSAYRGDVSRQGWTTEADLLDGQRIDPDVLAEEDGAGYFGMFSVRPDLQGGGVGKAMLAEAERIAREEWQLPTMRMTVIDIRDELIAFYGRRGYARTGIKKPFPYGDERYGIPKRADLRFEILEKPLTGAAA